MGLFKVSHSKVKLWRNCHFAYYLKYIERLRKIVKSRPLQFGSIIHEMLAAIAEGEDPFTILDEVALDNQKLFVAEREMYGEIIEDIWTVMEEYLNHYANDSLRYISYKGKKSEHDLEIEIDNSILLVFRIDAFAKTKNKLRWLIENKTGKKVLSADQKWRNVQTSIYLQACQMLGIKAFDGVMWNSIRSKAPTKPQVLKNGNLSSRAIDTLPGTVKRILKEKGLKKKDHKVLLEHARDNIATYFNRTFTPMDEGVVRAVFQDFKVTAHDIMDLGGIRRERSIDRHCDWCDYGPICRAELTGADSDFIKEREYAKKNRDEEGNEAKE